MGDSPPNESLDSIVADALRRIAEAMQRAKRISLRGAIEANGLKLTFTARRSKPRRCEQCNDLPPEIAGQSKATRRVYRTLRACRSAEGGADRVIWQQDVCAAIEAANPTDPLSIRTVHRAMAKLCELNVIRKDAVRGYLMGGQQPTLPF